MPRSQAVHRLSAALAVLAGGFAIALGGGALARWATSARAETGLPSGVGTPSPEAAAGLAMTGLGLILAIGTPRRWRLLLSAALGAAVALVGLLGLMEQAGLTGPSPVAAYLRQHLDPAAPPMTTANGCTLLLLGLALATLYLRPVDVVTWPQVFAPAAATIAGVTLVAYLFRETSVPALSALVAMTPLAAVGVLGLSAGILAVRPGQGLLGPLRSFGPGGVLTRRVGPTLLLLPFGIALVSGALIQVGSGEPALTVALSTTAFVLVLLVVLSGTARMIDNEDERRRGFLTALAAERDFTATLLRSLSEAVVVADAELRVIDANPAACALLDRDRADLLGRRPPYPWQDDPQQLRYGGRRRFVRRPDGEEVPVLAMTAPVLDDTGRPRAYVSTFVDVTEQRQAEDRITRHAAELEEANAQLQVRQSQLLEAAAFKNDLMSLVAHEVSQPLSSVASLSELLTTEWADLPDDMRQELADKIDRNTRRLTGMINDMLLLFRLDAGMVSARRAAVPVAEVVDTVTDASPQGVPVTADIDPHQLALVDRGHLWQILHNLVDNAVRYGEPPVEVSARGDADGVTIAVRDHGAGIPEEDRPSLFERVARRSGDKLRVKGTGLGLFIVRHLVELNNGRIWYEPADPRGARLVVRLEAVTAARAGAAPASGEADAARTPDGAHHLRTPGDADAARASEEARAPGDLAAGAGGAPEPALPS